MPFLRLLKSGEWVFGADDTDVEAGSLWAVDPNSFCMGFQAWNEDGELQGEITQLVTEQPVLRSELKEVDGEWRPLMGCILVCISGEDEGLMVSYKTTSKGGIKALGKLMQELVSRIKSNPADGTYIPVVELIAESYKHKKYGRIYTPAMVVKEWTDEEELMSPELPDDDMLEDEPEPTPAPRKRAAKKAEPKPEPEPEVETDEEPEEDEEPAPKTEAPAPRRRRRAV